MNQKTIKFKIPYLGNKDIISRVNSFLKEYDKKKQIPVDIEYIVEAELGIVILPTQNLKRNFGIDAFVTSDFNKIVIDQEKFENYENRARFSIAHELAHIVLHKEIYQTLEIKDEESYIEFQENGDPETKKRMEAQAYIFAGYLLIPQQDLNITIEKKIKKYGGLENVSVEELKDMMDEMCDRYTVSSICLRKQIELEQPNLLKQIESLAKNSSL